MKKLKHNLFPVLSSFILVFSSYTPLVVNAEENQEKEVIVVYKNENGKDDIVEESKKVEYEFQTVPAMSVVATEEDLKKLESNSNIEYIEENVTFSITETKPLEVLSSVQNGSTDDNQWNIKATNAQNSWNEGYTGDGIKVAVLDTGIATHNELKIAGGVSTVDYTTSWQDDNGHGTHVSGIIAAQPDIKTVNGVDITGVAPDVDLYAVKVLNSSGSGTLQDILQGLDWAIANDMDIINLSLGNLEYSQLFEQMINDAYAKGILIVAASGNNGLQDSVHYPAKFDNVIAVTSVNESLNISDFSSTGNEVDFSAPGEDIISTYTGGTYVFSSGTSQAAPHVTGMLAVLKEEYPQLTNSELKALLSKNTKDLGVAGQDSYYGYGMIYYNSSSNVYASPAVNPSVSYSTHVQDIGWQNAVSDGVMSGTAGQAKRLESIKISIGNSQDLGVKYSTHVQDYGWLNYVSDGNESGSTGQAKRLEGIKIELTGPKAADYNIYYRVHAQDYGWLKWVKNGELSGTTGEAKRLEAIEIKIVEKSVTSTSVTYRTHAQDYGWLNLVADGEISGTVGQAKRLEAMQVSIKDAPYTGGISYKTQVQDYGWLSNKSDGEISGTMGESKRVEAIQVSLTGEMANYYDVYYRAHSQTFGWLGWVKNGETAGTVGKAKQLEAIQIVLVIKGGEVPTVH